MGLWTETLIREIEDVQPLSKVNTDVCQDTDIVNVSASVRDGACTLGMLYNNEKKPCDSQQEKTLSEALRLNQANYSSIYPTENFICYFDGSIQWTVRSECDFVMASAKHSQYTNSFYRGTKYNLLPLYTDTRYCKIKKKQCEDVFSGNVSDKIRLELANGHCVNKFACMETIKPRCKEIIDTFLHNEQASADGGKGVPKCRKSIPIDGTGMLCDNRNNSRCLDSSEGESDEDGDIEDSKTEDSKSEVTKSEDSKREVSKSEDSSSQKSDSEEVTRSEESVAQGNYSDSKSKESREVKDGNAVVYTDCDNSSEEAADTECSIDFENVSGSVFWSEEVSNDNHIDNNDDNHDDKKDMTYCENTINEESNDFCVRNYPPSNTVYSRKHHSPFLMGLSTGQSVTNNSGNYTNFLGSNQDIPEPSAVREAVLPILTQGRPALPYKLVSLTSNRFENYKRLFDAFKTKIFPSYEKDNDNCEDRKDSGGLRRCLSITDNDSATERSHRLQISSSDSEICKKGQAGNTDSSRHSSIQDVDESYRALPAWCDWESDFDYVIHDYREARSPKVRTVPERAQLVDKVTGNRTGKGDADRSLRDQGQELKEAKRKHFSSCKKKRDSGITAMHPCYKGNDIKKSTGKGSVKKKQINFKFQRPSKDNRYQYISKAMCAIFADSSSPNVENLRDVALNQTSIINSKVAKSMSLLSLEEQAVISTKDINSLQEAKESKAIGTSSKDTDCGQASGTRKGMFKTGNREGKRHSVKPVSRKQLQPYEIIVCDTRTLINPLADLKTPSEMLRANPEKTTDNVGQGHSALEAPHLSLENQRSLELVRKEKPHTSENSETKRLPLPDCSNSEENTIDSSPETLTSDINKHTNSHKRQSEPDKHNTYLPEEHVDSITSQKATLLPEAASRHPRDVVKDADTQPQENVKKKSNHRCITITPTVLKAMSKFSLGSLSSPQIKAAGPKHTVFGPKAQRRRLDGCKGGKSKDHGNRQKKRLGNLFSKLTKPSESPSQASCKKSGSEQSVTTVPGIITECILSITALASNREHKCYHKDGNRSKVANVDDADGRGLTVDQPPTENAKPPTEKSDKPPTVDGDKVKEKDPQTVPENLGLQLFSFNKNDYYYGFRRRRSRRLPDSEAEITICSPAKSVSSSKGSDIYFTNKPRGDSLQKGSAECSRKSSLTDIYFLSNRYKYELLGETIDPGEDYQHSYVHTPSDVGVLSLAGSLCSSPGMKTGSRNQHENDGNQDILFYDDCLLDLINKRVLTNTANPDTSTNVCCSDEVGSEVESLVPNLMQTLTINDLLAGSMCPPPDESSLVDSILPNINVIQEPEVGARSKHQRKRKRAKRKRDKNIQTPPQRKSCLKQKENAKGTDKTQNEYDKSADGQDAMAGTSVAQSIVLTASEDANFETKLVNYQNQNLEEFHRGDEDYKSMLKSSNLESNTSWQTDEVCNESEIFGTSEGKQFVTNEPDPSVIEDKDNEELSSPCSYGPEDQGIAGDTCECDPSLKHKLALLLQRIEDTNCIKIVSTQEFYKRKHGATSFLNDLAKMIDNNLERCNENNMENENNQHDVAANEPCVPCSPRKAQKKEKMDGKLEEQCAKKVQDCAGEGKQLCESRHKQDLFDAQEDEEESLEAMGSLARHVRKQICAMNRYNESDDMSLSEQNNTLCAYSTERQPPKEINKKLRTPRNATHKEPTRIEHNKPFVHENKGTIQRSTEPRAGKRDKNYNTSLVLCAAEGGKAQNTEGKKEPTGRANYSLHNKSVYLDSAGSIKREIGHNKSDCNRRDNCKKINDDDSDDDDDDDDDDDSCISDDNTVQASSKSSTLTSRDATVSQLRMKADIQSDEFHRSKDTSGSTIRQHQYSAPGPPQTPREPHNDPEDVFQKSGDQLTHVFMAKNSENKTCHEAVENENDGQNGKLCSGLKDTSNLKIISCSYKGTSRDAYYWEDDVTGKTKVDRQNLEDDYGEYKKYYPFIDAASDNKSKVILKTVGTQFEPSEMMAETDETNHKNILVNGSNGSPDIYYNKDRLSASGSESDLSKDSTLYQTQTEETSLLDRGIPQVLSCQTIYPTSETLKNHKRKKNVTFQEDENRESNKKNSSSNPTDSKENDGSIDDHGRTAEQGDTRVQHIIYNKNITLANNNQQTNSVKRSASKALERGVRTLKSSVYSADCNNEREITRPGFVSYIHKHRLQKAELKHAKEFMSLSSSETLSSQHSRDKKRMTGHSKGAMRHESPRKNGQYSRTGASRKELQTAREIHQYPSVSQRVNMTDVSFRRNTRQKKSAASQRQFISEDCVKHSIASLNSNDRSESRAENCADTVNRPVFSLTGSPKASVEYTISGKTKPNESNQKKVPNPRADQESTYVQRGHGGPEVAKKVFEETRSGFRVGLVEPEMSKNGLKVARNEFEVVRGGFKVADNEPNVASNGLKVTQNTPDMARNEHRIAWNEFDMARISRELIKHPVGRNLSHCSDHLSQSTAKQTSTMETLSMINKVDARKWKPASPCSLEPTLDREVMASRSVSCHDMRASSLTKERAIQGSDEHLQKHRGRYKLNYPSPTFISQKKNYKAIFNDRTYSNEVEIPQTPLSSKSLPEKASEIQALMARKSVRGNPKESEIMASSKLFRGNPRDNDDMLGTRNYSSEGFFIPENDDEDKGNTHYLKALGTLADRFSPELKRRNSLPNYDFPERYHNLHSCSPSHHTAMPRQNLFASTGTRSTWEDDQMAVFRPQPDETWEKAYLESKQQELQKGFQDYWGERMKMRREEFERLRQEYQPRLCSAVGTAITFQNENLVRRRVLHSGNMPTIGRSWMDKTPRKTTLYETFKRQRKKAVSEIETIPRKTARSSMGSQAALRLSDVDVEVHRVDSSTVQRLRSQSKDCDNERPRQKLSEFPAKDLFAFAHKTLLGSHFQKERMPSPELTQDHLKSAHESRSPSLLSRIINSFSRSDKVRFMTGKENEVRSESSQPKESILSSDGSGEGFASVANDRDQVVRTTNYSAHIGMHHRNKRRQSHSPQMSLLGLRDLRSDYNQNMNFNAKTHTKQFVQKTKIGRLFYNKHNVQYNLRKQASVRILTKHVATPMIFPPQSNEVSIIHKKPNQSLSYAYVVPGQYAKETESSKSKEHFNRRNCRLAGYMATSLPTASRTMLLLMVTLALSLSMHCDNCFQQLSFRMPQSNSDQTSSQERYSGEAKLPLLSTVPGFGSM